MQQNIKGPCVNCESRKVGCHGDCIRYNAWALTFEGVKAKERQAQLEALDSEIYKRHKRFEF